MHKRYAFCGGTAGSWRVLSQKTQCGESLPQADFVEVQPVSEAQPVAATAWILHGLISNLRYATRIEVGTLRSVQEELGRPIATRAALIPIKKSDAWWALAQDERRAIFEEQSHHTEIGLRYLPSVARQLYHARDLEEPFDFLTWFEYPADQTNAFEELVSKLRASEEWRYVDREVDFRLEQA